MMRTFLLRGVLFVSVTAAIFLANFCLNLLFIRSSFPDLENRVLIAGDSHVMYGMNPALFSSAASIAQEAEPYVVTFYKLKSILKISKVDTLVLGLSYHNLARYNDLKLTDSKWSKEMFERVYPLLTYREMERLGLLHPRFLQVWSSHMLLYPIPVHNSFVGHFKKQRGTHLEKAEDDSEIKYLDEIGKINNQFLDSIVSLCRATRKQLILVNTPLHRQYLNKVPDIFIEKMQETLAVIVDRGTVYLDYQRFEIPDDHFYNETHLNAAGADLFTKRFVHDLKNASP